MTASLSHIGVPRHAPDDWLARSLAWLVDLIYPPVCGNCARVDSRFCAACLGLLARLPLAPASRRVDMLDAVMATGAQTGLLRRAVLSLKYEGAVEIAPALGQRMLDALAPTGWAFDVIAPVPLHESRLGERGYNQARLLGDWLADATGAPCRSDLLARTRDTPQQARLKEAQERRDNVKGAFAAVDKVAGQSILLVDDVVTTGATLGECAAALRAAGATELRAVTASHA